MSQARNIRVELEVEGIYRKLFSIGYTANGFFIHDLFDGSSKYLVGKMNLPYDELMAKGEAKVFMDQKNEKLTMYKPKLSHHMDGLAHISGQNIISGFFPASRKPKGIGLQSFNLVQRNFDGGPIFGFLCWGTDRFPPSKAEKGRKVAIEKRGQFNFPARPPINRPAVVVEGFYFHKNAVTDDVLVKGLRHRSMGIIPVHFVPTESRFPGRLGLICYHMERGEMGDADFGFFLTGAPGMIVDKRMEQLFIAYPPDKILGSRTKRKLKSVDFIGLRKFGIIFRDRIERILLKLQALYLSLLRRKSK